MASVDVNAEPVVGFARAMREAPDVLLVELTKGFRAIAEVDTKVNRADLQRRLKVKGDGRLDGVIRSVASDIGRPTSVSKLFISEYSKWAPTQIFQTGGVIRGADKWLTVLTEAARTMLGPRDLSAKLRQLVTSRQARLIPTPRGFLIVLNTGGTTKTGRPRSGSHDTVLAVLRRQVTEPKLLQFYENVARNDGLHQDILETAVENTLVELTSRSGTV